MALMWNLHTDGVRNGRDLDFLLSRAIHVSFCGGLCPGGLAQKVLPVIDKGIAVVFGHGGFATDQYNFRVPLQRMIDLKNWCKIHFLLCFSERYRK